MIISERRTEGDRRACVPRQTVPDRRRHRSRHEDAQGALTQPAHIRTLQPTQVPRQGNCSNLLYTHHKLLSVLFKVVSTIGIFIQ